MLLVFNLVAVTYFGLEGNLLTLLLFGLMVIIGYGFVCTVAGEFHIRKQMGTDGEIASLANPVTLRMLASLERIEKKLELLNLEGDR